MSADGLITGRSVERGPSAEGDLSVETRGLLPVPDDERHGPTWRIFTVWFSANMVPPTFFVGTLAGADFIGLGFRSGLIAILLGNVIGASVMGLMATMGPRTGMPQLALGRLSFGRSNILPAVLNWGMMIGWTAFDTFFGATAFHLLTGGPFWLGALLTIVLMMIIVRVGYEAIMMYQKYMAMALSVVFIIIAVKVVMIGDFSRPDAVAGGERVGAFILMTTLSASFAMSWSVFGSDYTRYLPKETPAWKVFAFAAGGLAVACSWLQILGLAVASIVVGSSVGTLQNDVLGGGLLGGIALVAIFFGIISVDALNTYTGSLSFLTIGIRLTRTQSVLLAAVVAFAATLWLESQNFAETFSNYLLIISYWIAPFAGVVAADWLLRRRQADVSGIQSIQRLPFGTKALVSFVVGAAASVPFMSATLYVGPLAKAMYYTDIANYVGLVVAAAVYAALTRWVTTSTSTD